MFALGQSAPLEDAVILRIKLKDYGNSLKSERVGVVDVRIEDIRASCEAEGSDGYIDGIYDIGTAHGMRSAATGKIHLRLLYHAPPPDPQPFTLSVRAVDGKNLLSADTNGFSDPYVKVKLLTRTREHVKSVAGKDAELRTTTKYVTLNPVWGEVCAFYDQSLGPPPLSECMSRQEWAWPAAAPADLESNPVHRQSVDLASASVLQFVLKDEDKLKSDDDLGEVSLPFSLLFGDEDAVMYENTLRVDRYFRVKPHKGMDKHLEGKLGTVRLDIVLTFDDLLVPPGWVEAVDEVTLHSYYFNTRTGRSQWEVPAEFDDFRRMGGAAMPDLTPGPLSAAEAGWELAGPQGHKPPKPVLPPSPSRGGAGAVAPAAEATHAAAASAASAASAAAATATAFAAAAAPAPAATAPASAPASAPPAISAKHSTSAGGDGGAEEEDGEGDEDEEAPAADAEAIDRAVNAMMGGGKKKEVIAASIDRSGIDLSPASGGGDREKAFFEAMRKKAEEKRKAEDAQKAVRVASMTPEEQAEFEKEQAAEARRQQRKDRMLSTQLGAYGTGAAAVTRGRGRGRGRGGASPTK